MLGQQALTLKPRATLACPPVGEQDTTPESTLLEVVHVQHTWVETPGEAAETKAETTAETTAVLSYSGVRDEAKSGLCITIRASRL